MDAANRKDHSNLKKKQKTNKSQNYNFTCVHQRPENKQGILKPEEDKKTKQLEFQRKKSPTKKKKQKIQTVSHVKKE